MPLEVRPMTLADAPKWASLHYPAFKDAAIGILWTAPPSQSSTDLLATQFGKAISNPDNQIFKCVDTDINDELVGIAFWEIFPRERTMEEVLANQTAREPFPEENRPARLEFMQGLWDAQRETMGTKPHVELAILVVDPKHQRRGIGRMLVQWGVDKSEELGIPATLEASKAGFRLYSSVGYKEVKRITFKTAKYGGTEDDVHVVSCLSLKQMEYSTDANTDDGKRATVSETMNEETIRFLCFMKMLCCPTHAVKCPTMQTKETTPYDQVETPKYYAFIRP